MTAMDFNDRGQANVSFSEFNDYMNERKEQYYYNNGGCLIGKYDNYENYGVTY